MRFNLRLDEDVIQLLEEERRRTGDPIDELANRALRLGLVAAARPARKTFTVEPRNLGLTHAAAGDCVEQVIEHLEDGMNE